VKVQQHNCSNTILQLYFTYYDRLFDS